jgi:cytochrome c2
MVYRQNLRGIIRHWSIITLLLAAAGCGTPAAVSVGAAVEATTAPTPTQSNEVRGGDAANGQTVFTTVGACRTCHDVEKGIPIVGPSLKGIASRAGNRKPGVAAADYLHESIVKPNAYVVDGFNQNIMPPNMSELLTPQEVNDLVAYLMTLK